MGRILKLLFARGFLPPNPNERKPMKALFERILNEPVLVVAVILAAGNLIGEDFTGLAESVKSTLVVIGGIVARHFVTPVRNPNLS
jgi:hypothetical protein